jgi:hypothetical protein
MVKSYEIECPNCGTILNVISIRTKEGLSHAKKVGKRGPDKKPRKTDGYFRRWNSQFNTDSLIEKE